MCVVLADITHATLDGAGVVVVTGLRRNTTGRITQIGIDTTDLVHTSIRSTGALVVTLGSDMSTSRERVTTVCGATVAVIAINYIESTSR